MTEQQDIWDECSYRPPKPPPRKRTTPKRDLEGAVLKECLKWLRDHPQVLYVERRNTGAIQFEDDGYVAFGYKGAADIWCIVPWGEGCFPDGATVQAHVEIECKRRSGGRLSPAQKEFRQLCRQIAVPYLVVTSAEDLAKKFKTLNLTD